MNNETILHLINEKTFIWPLENLLHKILIPQSDPFQT